MIPELNREQLYQMTTQQLYDLDGQLTVFMQKIKAELVCRGDY